MSITFPSLPPITFQFFYSAQKGLTNYSSYILEGGKKLLEKGASLSGRVHVLMAFSFAVITIGILAFRFFPLSKSPESAPKKPEPTNPYQSVSALLRTKVESCAQSLDRVFQDFENKIQSQENKIRQLQEQILHNNNRETLVILEAKVELLQSTLDCLENALSTTDSKKSNRLKALIKDLLGIINGSKISAEMPSE